MAIIYRLSPHQLVRLTELMRRVFNICELLEHILSFLPAFTQLQMRAVCKDFQTAIDTAPPIRVNMFRKRPRVQSGVEASIPALAPYRIRGISHKIVQAKGKKRVVLEMDNVFYTLDYPRLLRHSRILRSVQLAQPAPDSVRLFRDCWCSEPEVTPVSTSSHGTVTYGHVFRAMDALGHKCSVCRSFQRFRVRANYT